METFKKILKDKTLFIENGVHMELVKFNIQEPLWGYDETYDNDEKVSSGFLHYNKGRFFLSKNNFNKPLIKNL